MEFGRRVGGALINAFTGNFRELNPSGHHVGSPGRTFMDRAFGAPNPGKGNNPAPRDLRTQQVVRPMTIAQQRNAGTFRNAAGKKVPAKAAAVKGIANLLNGQRLTKNQNVVVGKVMIAMGKNERRNFGNQLALARFPGQNVNVSKQTFIKPLGKAIKVAKQVKRNANKR